MSEYSGFILVDRNTLGLSIFVGCHRMSENSGVGLHKFHCLGSENTEQTSSRRLVKSEFFLLRPEPETIVALRYILINILVIVQIMYWQIEIMSISYMYKSNVLIPFMRVLLDIPLCNKVCQWLAVGRWFSLSTPIFPTNKTDRHDIAEMLLKETLNTIILTL
jgi:hypothetical protein